MGEAPDSPRVLHLITEVIVGGAQDNTILTVEGLRERGYEVHLASGPGGGWEQRAREAADAYIPMRWMQRSTSPLRNLMALFETYGLVRRGDYEIVHTHSTIAGILGRWACRLARTPIVVHTLHTLPGEDQTFPGPVRRGLVVAERWASKVSDAVIAVTELNRQQAVERRIAPANKLVVVHSGIDTRRFTPIDEARKREILDALGIAPGTPVVGWVGRMARQNAPEVFVAAARRIVEEVPQAVVLMAGDGPLLEDTAAACREIPQIRCLGYRSDIPELLQCVTVFASTVRWAGLGRALTEAMMAGVPVVTTGVGGIPDLVADGDTGLLVETDDPESVAASVLRLLEDPALGARLADAGRRRVATDFGVDRMVDDIAVLYGKLRSR